MESLNTWLINGVYICVIIVFICGWLFYLRAHYAKAVIGKVLCEFITSEGNNYFKLLPVTDGKIVVKPKGKKPGRMYVIADIATYQTDYPSVPRFLSMISTKVKKTIVDEDSWEPLTNRRGMLLLSPVRLYNMMNERFSQVGLEQAKEEFEGTRRTRSAKFDNWLLYLLVGGILLGVICIGWFVVSNFDTIKAALGIQ